jgi:hypothetical protein
MEIEGLSKIKITPEMVKYIYELQTGSHALDETSGSIYSGVWEIFESVNDLIHWLINASCIYDFDEKHNFELVGHLHFLEGLKEDFGCFELPRDEHLEQINNARKAKGWNLIEKHELPELK